MQADRTLSGCFYDFFPMALTGSSSPFPEPNAALLFLRGLPLKGFLLLWNGPLSLGWENGGLHHPAEKKQMPPGQ